MAWLRHRLTSSSKGSARPASTTAAGFAGAAFLLALVAGLIVLPVASPPSATLLGGLMSSAAAVEVIGDDELDQYSGSGSVILPSSIEMGSRHRASNCPGCRWKVTKPCLRTDEHQDAGCRGIVLGCPQGREIQRAWLAVPGRDFEPVGLFCPSEGEAISVADLSRRVRGDFTRRLPPLQPVCEPQRGVVVGIPLHCRSGQLSAHAGWTDIAAGFTVQTSARAQWIWSFHGTDGRYVRREVTSPGQAYPNPGVRQQLWTTGANRVRVLATWQGEFSVDGLGPFAIAPHLTQEAELTIPTAAALGVIRQ